jgi:hypothetical protein
MVATNAQPFVSYFDFRVAHIDAPTVVSATLSQSVIAVAFPPSKMTFASLSFFN